MPERATRPLNDSAAQAADDDLYQNHAADPRPNALYDADGNRKPLSPDDPQQAGLRQEWMTAYKANGGETEQSDTNAAPIDQAVTPCGDQKVQVDPLIVGAAMEYDEAEEEDEESGATDDSDEPDDSSGDADSVWTPPPDDEPESDDE